MARRYITIAFPEERGNDEGGQVVYIGPDAEQARGSIPPEGFRRVEVFKNPQPTWKKDFGDLKASYQEAVERLAGCSESAARAAEEAAEHKKLATAAKRSANKAEKEELESADLLKTTAKNVAERAEKSEKAAARAAEAHKEAAANVTEWEKRAKAGGVSLTEPDEAETGKEESNES